MDYLIYLAGPIAGLSWEAATKWRKDLIEKFKDASTGRINYIALSPLRGKEYLENETDIKNSYHRMLTPKATTERNLNDIRRSDLIIVNFIGAEKVSIETVLEIGAAKALNIPIILVIEDPKEITIDSDTISLTNGDTSVKYLSTWKNIHDHSMIRESSSLITSHIDDAFDFALHLLGN